MKLHPGMFRTVTHWLPRFYKIYRVAPKYAFADAQAIGASTIVSVLWKKETVWSFYWLLDVREMSVNGNDELWLAILVHNSRTCLKPHPLRVTWHQPVRYQSRAACLDHCNTHILMNVVVFIGSSVVRHRLTLQLNNN